jgi:hypothetical protein
MIASVLGSTAPALAQTQAPESPPDVEHERPRPPPRPPRGARVYGVGISSGGGVTGFARVRESTHDPAIDGASYTSYFGDTLGAVTAVLGLPALEVSGFVDDHFSIDVSFSALNTLLFAALGGGLGLTTTVHFDWSFGDDLRFLVGPGLGLDASAGEGLIGYGTPEGSTFYLGAPNGMALRLSALLGLEAIGGPGVWGFRLMTRPWFSIGGGQAGMVLGGGALLEVACLGYGL